MCFSLFYSMYELRAVFNNSVLDLKISKSWRLSIANAQCLEKTMEILEANRRLKWVDELFYERHSRELRNQSFFHIDELFLIKKLMIEHIWIVFNALKLIYQIRILEFITSDKELFEYLDELLEVDCIRQSFKLSWIILFDDNLNFKSINSSFF